MSDEPSDWRIYHEQAPARRNCYGSNIGNRPPAYCGAPGAASASSAQPVRTEIQAARLTCGASMTNSHPADYTSTGVKVRTVPFAHIKTVAHYRTVTHPKYRTANAARVQVLEKHLERAREGAASSYLSMAWETAQVPASMPAAWAEAVGPQRLPVPLP